MTIEFEQATDKNKKYKDINELQASVARIKDINIPVAKPLCDMHTNICYDIKDIQKKQDVKQFFKLEQIICHEGGDALKEIIKKLETKIARQVNVDQVVRLICLLSLTLSGFKKDELEHLRKILIMNYGYQESATLANL